MKLVPAFPDSLDATGCAKEESLRHLGRDRVVALLRKHNRPLTPENYHEMAGLAEDQWGNAEAEDAIPEPFRLVHPSAV